MQKWVHPSTLHSDKYTRFTLLLLHCHHHSHTHTLSRIHTHTHTPSPSACRCLNIPQNSLTVAALLLGNGETDSVIQGATETMRSKEVCTILTETVQIMGATGWSQISNNLFFMSNFERLKEKQLSCAVVPILLSFASHEKFALYIF